MRRQVCPFGRNRGSNRSLGGPGGRPYLSPSQWTKHSIRPRSLSRNLALRKNQGDHALIFHPEIAVGQNVCPTWLALINGTKDQNLRSISWGGYFDPYPNSSVVRRLESNAGRVPLACCSEENGHSAMYSPPAASQRRCKLVSSRHCVRILPNWWLSFCFWPAFLRGSKRITL